MRTGSAARGFTYLGLLALLAIGGAALAALGRTWSTVAQREREGELRFRGEQIRDAIGRYRRAGDPPAWPQTFEQLLEDRRGPEPRHHLRRLWPDPFTGRPDWVLLPASAPAGVEPTGFAGVRSRSDAARLAGGSVKGQGPAPKVSDWSFEYVDANAGVPGTAASAAASRRDRP